MTKKKINIIGGGCAGFSIIRRLDEIKNAKFNIFTGNEIQKDHFWGFWATKDTKDFDPICLKWNSWKIINYQGENVFKSKNHPYCIINRKKWIKFCLEKANKHHLKIFKNNVKEKKSHFFFKNLKLEGDLFLDSRKPILKKNIMLQDFVGLTIKSEKNIFDFSTVILMDFRCDQSKGLHFIYLIPFEKNKALIESTIFSTKVENKSFYINAIQVYLKKFYKLNSFKILNEERGIIPMVYINQKNNNSVSIGVRGGATRPSSGYTFVFIQKQITKLINQLNKNSKIDNQVHSGFDLFMDQIFIKALKTNPKYFPTIIYNMFSNLSGDEMALFMNGNSKFFIWFKIILSLPKKLFLNSFWKTIKDV